MIRFCPVFTSLMVVSAICMNACSPDLPVTEEQQLDSINLPAGFHPEGIIFGRGSIFYVGSLFNGSIWRGNAKTGEGSILHGGESGKMAVGMDFDPRSNAIYVCGGTDGALYVYSGETGQLEATFQLNSKPQQRSLINDVVVTKDAAWATSSWEPVLYRISLGRNGEVTSASDVRPIQLGGEWEHVPFEKASHINGINANGIISVNDDKTLIVMHTSAAGLYAVDSDSGEAKRMKISGAKVAMGDGLTTDESGRIYVVQSFANRVSVIEPDAEYTKGRVLRVITSRLMQIPTSADIFDDYIYFVNGRFDAAPPRPQFMPNMGVDFTISRVRLNP